MKKFFSNLMAALVAIMAVNLFLPVASADALSYSLDPVTVNLDAAQSGRFQITVQPDAPFGGVDFLVSLPSEVEITSVSYSVSGISPSPGEREGGIYFGISSLMNAYTDPLVCTVNIKYTGTGTAPSDIVIFLVRLTKYTGEIGVIDTAIVPPFGANLVTAVPNSGSNPPSPVPAVTGVTVTPGTASVTRGTTQQFTASVAAVGGAAETVNWQVVGNVSTDTTISAAGLLTVAAGETADALQVTATSTFDGTKQGTAAVTVLPASPVPPVPAVTGVTVTPGTASVTRGTTQQFTASVAAVGGAAETVNWQVAGNVSTDTTISAAGLLTVAAGETAGTLQVTATSTFDNTKQGNATVTVLSGGSSYTPSPSPSNTGSVVTEVPETETPLAQAFSFMDVSEDDWFYGDVYYMWENSLMNGTSATRFSPGRTLTRGMAVTVLYRTEGAPDTSELDNPFPDVSVGQYYTEAVIWAADHEIVLGYTDGQFGPDDDITREQMAAILYRYERYAQKVPPDTLEGRVFADESSIGDYAKEAVAKLVTQGIVAGKPNNRFDPRGNATRAEFAAVLHRFMEAVKED